MSRSLIFMILVILGSLVATQKAKAEPRFTFHENTAQCLDQDGQEGLNVFDAKTLFQGITPTARAAQWPARKAQCIDFASVKFHQYLGANYSVLVAWDFRGSKFNGAELSFNFIENGLFAGSNIETLQIGYGRVTAADVEFDQGDMTMP